MNYISGLLWALLMLFVASCAESRKSETFELRTGDILFQDLDCGPYCESIESVTKGIGGADLSHCGIVLSDPMKGKVVVEAISRGVSITPVDSFLSRSEDAKGNPKVLVGRLNSWGEKELESAVNRAINLVGRPYDGVYDLYDSSYYCSELIYYSYLKNEQPVFKISPMTFKSHGDTVYFPEWLDYFSQMDMEVPEGEPGLNPGSISLDKEVKIVHSYGLPDGYLPTENSP